MKSTTIISTLLGGATALNVVKFDIRGVRNSASRLSKRDTIDGELDNLGIQYNINLTIGTPPQPFSLQLDTGSSDLWVNTAKSAYCSASDSNCTGGLFDPSASSTYQDYIPGGFDISYVDTTGASGDYGLDTVVISGVTILNQTIGVANVSNITAGLIGVAFPDNEAICNSDPVVGPCTKAYPSIIDSMVSQGKINSRAYSLWLDDLNASTGSILFGGLDLSKFQGDLTVLDIIPDYSNDTFTQYKNFNVLWSNLTVSTLDNFWNDSNAAIAILDSGTSLTYVPPDVYQTIADGFNVSTDNNYDVDCSLASTGTTFDFTFGGSDGATISVDISEFVLSNGDGTCSFGILPSTEESCLLGDTFLRSAYVVYDLDDKQIGIAQTDFNGGEANIVELGEASIPGANATATASVPPAATSGLATATQIGPVTATGNITVPHGTATGTAPATYTGAGVSLRAGSKYASGCIVAALAAYVAM